MSTGGDTDRRAPTGAMLSSDLLVTLNQPASRLIENLPAASMVSSDWAVAQMDGVAGAGVADARPRISNAEVAAVIRWCISVPHSIVSARVSAHPHGPGVGDSRPRKSV